MGNEIAKWADQAMFKAEEMPDAALKGPQVHLLWMTPDPLGAAAAMNNIYEGRVSRSLADVTHAEREQVLADMQRTVLKVPMENIQFHFLFEGVTRAFTHQLVRQRHASFAQESMRFAVFGEEQALPVGIPPSLDGTMSWAEWYQHETEAWRRDNMTPEQKARLVWDETVARIEDAYDTMIDVGMAAEDARGLLPTNMLTRIHYVVNLRSLHQYAGLRLSTQAQFEWRQVWAGIISAIRTYNPYAAVIESIKDDSLAWRDVPMVTAELNRLAVSDSWQYEGIANLFRPICYYTGKCEFMGTADRYCNIRDRVNANYDAGRPSAEWHHEYDVVEGNPIVAGVGPQSVVRNEKGRPVFIGAIHPREWLENPAAARKRAE